MRTFINTIRKYRSKHNRYLVLKNLILAVTLYLLLINFFFAFFVITSQKVTELFIFGLSLKVFLGLTIIYLVLQTNNHLVTLFRAARKLDEYNQDKHDTYQNAYELFEQNRNENEDVLNLILAGADSKAEKQQIKPDLEPLKRSLIPLVITLFVTTVFAVSIPRVYLQSWSFFTSHRMPELMYRDYVEVTPGNLSITRYNPVTIEVIDPEPNVEHTLFYRYAEEWRSEALYQHRRLFSNPDMSFHYYVKTPYAVSDTFRIEVFEEPSVREITVRYNYPAYTGLEPDTDYQSNGNIRGLVNTSIGIEIETNNPLEEARLIFSDGNLINMERLGRSLFSANFQLKESGTYHFNLKDFLGNESQRLERPITVLPDRVPEIRIVYPGQDTIFTQNMMQRMKYFATDDFGLQNLALNYRINENEVISRVLQSQFNGTTVEYDYVFDLSNTYMLPGDRVVYWVEIEDNAPIPQKASSRHYILRFPSIEEIFAEIEREEEQKMEMMRSSIEQSRELQQDFEQKRREMMKREEFDWEDKAELNQFLQRQEELNKVVENLAEEYQNLLEKFADNPSLSEDTLEKMRRIRELMDEIADDRFTEAMQQMQQAMEQMNRDDIMKAMENLKFSMEEFDRKLQNTLDLLENIQKEQSIQKALAISEEMEKMQENLLERTEAGETDGEQLAAEQDKIRDKLDALKEQIEEAMSRLDDEKDAALKEALAQLQQEMEQSGLDGDLAESSENLQSSQMSEAAMKQQSALQKMNNTSQSLSEMNQSMMEGNMAEMGEIIEDTIKRLLTLSLLHQETVGKYVRDPFPIYPEMIAGFDALQIALQQLYSVPQVVFFITPKFILDSDMTLNSYRDSFQQIVHTRNPNISNHLNNIQKGINLMIFNLMQSQKNMSEGMGSGMQSMMQAMQQMGQEQMAMNMLTQQLLEQMGGDSGMTREMREQAQRIAHDEERLADNLRRLLETNPEAQRQASSINQLIEELESVSRQIRRNQIDESLIRRQERILSRMLDAQKSINQREFSRQREGETREDRDWELPPDVLREFQQMRQRALLDESYQNFPPEYQDLIREYLRILNLRSIEGE